MTQQQPHDHDKPYSEEDLGELDAPAFTQRPSPDGGGLTVTGTCPRCRGRTETEFRRGLPGTGSKGLFDRLTRRSPSVTEPEPLIGEVHFCACGHAHPQMPTDALFIGCGASWRIRP
ncbi:hypothetical protein [Streptomyces sp. NPDC059743]|uniref:hypothetical protein n=1 Tax=Streptomyces sp. NPDC059743 TaxID=3346928 RepID=UPI003669671E